MCNNTNLDLYIFSNNTQNTTGAVRVLRLILDAIEAGVHGVLGDC